MCSINSVTYLKKVHKFNLGKDLGEKHSDDGVHSSDHRCDASDALNGSEELTRLYSLQLFCFVFIKKTGIE